MTYLEKNCLSLQLLAMVNTALTARGLLLKSGTVVDATLIAAPSSTKIVHVLHKAWFLCEATGSATTSLRQPRRKHQQQPRAILPQRELDMPAKLPSPAAHVAQSVPRAGLERPAAIVEHR